MSFNLDNKLAPMGGSRGYDPYEGYRLGKAAVTAERFPRFGNTVDELHNKMNRHFIRLGLQILNENKRVQSVTRDEQTLRVQFVGTFTTLTAEELADELWACVPSDMVNWDGEFEGPRSIRLSWDRMDRAVQRAASYARDYWNPDWEAENRRRARKGGQTSKRGVSVSREAVSACLEAVEHLPERRRAAAIAELLTASGVKASARTVKRRLNELKSEDDCYAGLGATVEDKRLATGEFHLMPLLNEEFAGELRRVEAVRDGELAGLRDGRVEKGHGFLHELKVAQPTGVDQPDVFDRFYAMFHDWQRDWELRAHGPADVTAELEALLDERLPG